MDRDWPNYGKRIGRASVLWAAGVAVLFGAVSGCNSPGLPKWEWKLGLAPAAASQPAAAEAASTAAIPSVPPAAATSGRPTLVVSTFTFDVMRVRVPQGVFSDSAKIWNHLATDFLPGETVAMLHRNGLRAGRAGTDAWLPIRAILETQAGVETSQTRLTMSNGLPLLLELDQQPKDQILFLYRRDGTLAGAPWRSSTNLLRVDYGIPPTQADSVLLEVAPELRMESQAATSLQGSEQWAPPPSLERSRVIRDLAFRVQLRPGEFLAIGPSSTTRELPYIMGSLLLCEEKDGQKFESMYFITPTVSRTGS